MSLYQKQKAEEEKIKGAGSNEDKIKGDGRNEEKSVGRECIVESFLLKLLKKTGVT